MSSDHRNEAILPEPQMTVKATPSRAGLRRSAMIAWNVASWVGVIGVAVAIVAIAGLILVPRAMGWQGMVVLSGSMEPALKTGGLAFVEKVSQDEVSDLQPGEIISYRQPRSQSLVSHRIVEVQSDDAGVFFITKGDANTEIDTSPVRAGDVVGKVRWDVPQLGLWVQRLQDRTTYYIFLGIPAALLIGSEAWNIVKELRRNRRGEANLGTEHGAAS